MAVWLGALLFGPLVGLAALRARELTRDLVLAILWLVGGGVAWIVALNAGRAWFRRLDADGIALRHCVDGSSASARVSLVSEPSPSAAAAAPPVLEPEVLKALADAPTAMLSDALGRWGNMDPAIRPVAAGMQCFGPAFTLRCWPADNLTIHRAVELAARGDVLVIDGGSGTRHRAARRHPRVRRASPRPRGHRPPGPRAGLGRHRRPGPPGVRRRRDGAGPGEGDARSRPGADPVRGRARPSRGSRDRRRRRRRGDPARAGPGRGGAHPA